MQSVDVFASEFTQPWIKALTDKVIKLAGAKGCIDP